MNDYFPPFNMDMIVYPCPNPDAGLANLLVKGVPGFRIQSYMIKGNWILWLIHGVKPISVPQK